MCHIEASKLFVSHTIDQVGESIQLGYVIWRFDKGTCLLLRKCINRLVRTTITASAKRANETKRPVLRRLGRGPRSAGLCSGSLVISLRGGRIIGERSASLGIKLPGCYWSWYNYTKSSFQ